jgi:hypothetical protein
MLRAHLQHVDVLADYVNVFGAHHFGDYRQTGFLLGLAQYLQRFQAESLKIIRRSARLVSAAAQHGGARPFHSVGGIQQLLA